MYDSIKVDENFDFIFTDDGNVEIITGASSIANMLKLDFISNSDWELDGDLGLNWVNSANRGLLQIKNPEIQIVKEIQKKMESISGIREVKEIQINKKLDRSLSLVVIVIATDGSEIVLNNEVL